MAEKEFQEIVTDLGAGRADKHMMRRFRGAHEAMTEMLVRDLRPDLALGKAALSDPLIGAHIAWLWERETRGKVRELEVNSALDSFEAANALSVGLNDFEGTVPVIDGEATIPMYGRAHFVTDKKYNLANFVIDREKVTIGSGGKKVILPKDDLGVETKNWLPIRQIMELPGGGKLALDDVSPVRHDIIGKSIERLNSDEFAALQKIFREAWQILESDQSFSPHPEVIAEGLRTIVMLEKPGDLNASLSTADSFGAIGLTKPNDSARLAETLVHEWSHNGLYGLINLLSLNEEDLYNQDNSIKAYYAPWRNDPRPFEGLMQGTVAHIAIAEYFTTYAKVAPPADEIWAQMESHRWLRNTRLGIKDLSSSGNFTELGKRLMAELEKRCERLDQRHVTDEARHSAARASLDHDVSWRLRNQIPNPDAIQRLAERFRLGQHFEMEYPPTMVVCGKGYDGLYARRRLLDLRLRSDLFDELKAQPEVMPWYVPSATQMDSLLMTDEFSAALKAARLQIMEQRGRQWLNEAWVVYVLAHNELHPDNEASHVLCENPHVVKAIYDLVAASSEELIDPETVASWLAKKSR